MVHKSLLQLVLPTHSEELHCFADNVEGNTAPLCCQRQSQTRRAVDDGTFAEDGIGVHLRPKEGVKAGPNSEQKLAWLRQLPEWRREISGAREFVESVKTDIFHDQVFVYAPEGDIKELPAGALVSKARLMYNRAGIVKDFGVSGRNEH